MPFMAKGRKKKARPPNRDYRAQLFLILGFFGAGLTTELFNILHEWAKSSGGAFYWIYSLFIVFIAWPFFIVKIVKLIEDVYLRNN